MRKSPPLMRVEYCAHSCFAFADSHGRHLLVDPYSPELGYRLPLRRAAVTLVSHRHFDHDHLPAVLGRTTVVRGAGDHRVAGLSIRGVLAEHGGTGNGYVVLFRWEMDGVAVVHLSDLGTLLSPVQLRALGRVDLLLVPCGGGNWTLGPAEAAEVVHQVNPRRVIPMHYRTPLLNRELLPGLEPVGPFLERFDRVTRLAEASLEVSPQDPGGTEVLLVPHLF